MNFIGAAIAVAGAAIGASLGNGKVISTTIVIAFLLIFQ